MGGHELGLDFGSVVVTRRQRRAAAVHIADRIAAEHPQLTAAQLAADPHITAGIRELLAALGLTKEQQ